jgi:hypothetical protein
LQRIVNNSAVTTIRELHTSPLALVLFLIAVLASAELYPVCAQPATDEYKVKAAFLFHFAQLVDWPAGALSAGDQSLNVCVYDDEPSLRELQSTLERKPIANRKLHVRVLSKAQGLLGCNILFLSRDEVRHQAAVLKSLRGQPVLTVGETDTFLSDGGMIRLRLEEEKVRFDINLESADAAHLKISSRLLLLATTVTLGGGGEKGGR